MSRRDNTLLTVGFNLRMWTQASLLALKSCKDDTFDR